MTTITVRLYTCFSCHDDFFSAATEEMTLEEEQQLSTQPPHHWHDLCNACWQRRREQDAENPL